MLGGLTLQEREQVERRVFIDSGYKEKVQLIEEELIDEYIDGGLAEDERAAFASHFLGNPHLRLDVRIVDELKQQTGKLTGAVITPAPPKPRNFVPEPAPRESWLDALRRHRTPTFAVCLALLVFSAALLFWLSLKSQQLEHRLLYERSPRANLERELARLNTPRNDVDARAASEALASASARAELTPGIQRDAPDESAYPSINVPADAAYARLRLKLEPSAAAYQSFRALFKTADSDEQFEADLSPSTDGQERVVGVTLPLLMLPAGDYRIQLYGRDASGRLVELPGHYYHLRIVRRTR